MIYSIALLLAVQRAVSQYTTTWDPSNLPDHSEQDQSGTNACGTGNNQTSLCQNVFVNSLEDFCVWGAAEPNSIIGNIEQHVVSYCSHPGRGGRLFPPGTLKAAHFLETPEYIQVTGTGDFTNINIAAGDAGGELDPHGPDGLGNPHGGLVFSNVWGGGSAGQQVHEWTNFQSVDQFCIRVCKVGSPQAPTYCQHIYDVLGCVWNIPGQYGDGFTSCKGDVVIPMGLYPQPDGSTSTFHQGEPATPAAHPPAPSSQCTSFTSAALYAASATSTSSPGGSNTISTTSKGPTSRTGTDNLVKSTSTSTSSASRVTFQPVLALVCFVLYQFL